jgi:hypothetical protein
VNELSACFGVGVVADVNDDGGEAEAGTNAVILDIGK